MSAEGDNKEAKKDLATLLVRTARNRDWGTIEARIANVREAMAWYRDVYPPRGSPGYILDSENNLQIARAALDWLMKEKKKEEQAKKKNH